MIQGARQGLYSIRPAQRTCLQSSRKSSVNHRRDDDDIVRKRTLWEPQSNLLLSALHCIRAVDDVAANVNAVVATDGPGSGISGLCGACTRPHGRKEFPARMNGQQERGYRTSNCEGTVPMILRPVKTTPLPSHTIATTGPEMM